MRTVPFQYPEASSLPQFENVREEQPPALQCNHNAAQNMSRYFLKQSGL